MNCANCQHILQIEQKILHFMNWQLSRMGRNIDGLDNLTILYSRINRQKLFTSICSRRLLQLQYVSVVFWKNIRLKTLKSKTKHQTTFQWFIFRINKTSISQNRSVGTFCFYDTKIKHFHIKYRLIYILLNVASIQ